LKDHLAQFITDPTVLGQRLDNWDTAVKYQLFHAIALLVAGVAIGPSRLTNLTATFLTLGVLIFSGCLYLLVLTDMKWLGAIVPIGGLSFVIGWILLGVAAANQNAGARK
jgi:uncharacterized membrane protein YgdD (TMEM256/DUF423 family)